MKHKTAGRLINGAVAVLLLSGGYLLGRCTKTVPAPSEPVTEQITVHSGDTLWSIAEKYGSGDIRSYISHIMQINGLDDPVIYPGQVLKVVNYE